MSEESGENGRIQTEISYEEFLLVHQLQLKNSCVPQLYWQTLFTKLKNEVDYSGTAHLDPSTSIAHNLRIKANNIFLYKKMFGSCYFIKIYRHLGFSHILSLLSVLTSRDSCLGRLLCKNTSWHFLYPGTRLQILF